MARIIIKAPRKQPLEGKTGEKWKGMSPQKDIHFYPVVTKRRYQKCTELRIPEAPFAKLVREIIQHLEKKMGTQPSFRLQREALEALQEAAEAILVNEFGRTFY